MHLTNKNSILLMGLISISLTSCKRDKDEDPALISGLGGNLTIVAKPQHHGDPILNKDAYPDTAYIKFNTLDFPGTNPSSYDTFFAGETTGEDHVHIEGIKPGKMYIYMAGWDTTINQRVVGGVPVNTKQSIGELIVVVPVTE